MITTIIISFCHVSFRSVDSKELQQSIDENSQSSVKDMKQQKHTRREKERQDREKLNDFTTKRKADKGKRKERKGGNRHQ
jgi:hypothetical protein